MEHHHLLQLSPPPPAHLMMSPSFFDVGGCGGGFFGDVILPAALDDSGGDWVEDLMHLGELFGVGGDDDNAVVDGAMGGGGDHELHEWQQCEGVGSPDQPSCGDGDGDGDGDVSPPCGELACRDVGDGDGDGDNSATRKRRDRSKTIVSERKRRVRMKEKLYELRALVPNITKMDKASIIADAVVYVKDLQAHARELKEEVAVLEARPRSPATVQRRQQTQHRRTAPQVLRQEAGHHGRRAAAAALAAAHDNDERNSSGGGGAVTTHGARVAHVGAAQVGEGRFFVTVECEPAASAGSGGGLAASLCAAVESLSCFTVENSTLGCSPDRVVSTLTLKVSEAEEDAATIRECTVKLWVMVALLKEGFRPQLTVEIS